MNCSKISGLGARASLLPGGVHRPEHYRQHNSLSLLRVDHQRITVL